ncbi:MAG TPA: CUAEP/CCAEP-tail radical SAM protein, partial [Anaerolineae bacterium]|nr:CUAEP/CCAEP-tail radical SAM protein [Anaerolineae bacterium]
MVKVSLISPYELGRQPFGLASPAAWLREAGCEVHCLDLSVNSLDSAGLQDADLVAFYVPMHMATRMTVPLIEQVRQLNPQAHLCAYGLYAPVSADYLCRLGIQTILGGEFESGLVALADQLRTPPSLQPSQSSALQSSSPPTFPSSNLPPISLKRQQFRLPDRVDLPALQQYAQLVTETGHKMVGYTEATRGCKHLCRHCPIVPVYGGHFRGVQREIVLADIRQQGEAGAPHITFGDPDFFNGARHAL